MKIGVLVGKTANGFDVIGGPSEEIDALKKQMNGILDKAGKAGSGKTVKQYSKLWLADVSHRPIKARSCRG